MQPYVEIKACHIGKNHVRMGMGCEDYADSYSDEGLSIIVISDGHGDKNCFRSGIGARIACEAALYTCRHFHMEKAYIADILSMDFGGMLRELEVQIADVWRERVLRHSELNPFTEEELHQADDAVQEMYRSGARMEKAYGCTLVAAVLTETYWYALQIGDGKCIAAYPDGVFVEPIPKDEENCYGNHSTSLCNSNAVEFFRHYYSCLRPEAVFVFSDGVEESFESAALHHCLYSIAYWVQDSGLETAKAKLDELLPQISEGGSGDDVSLAAAVSGESRLPRPRQTIEQVDERVAGCAEILARCTQMSESVEESIRTTRDRIEMAKAEAAEMENRLTSLLQELESLSREEENLRKEQIYLREKREQAKEQMEKAERYKDSAENYWRRKYEMLGLPFERDRG